MLSIEVVTEMARDAGRLEWSPEAERLRKRIEDIDQWLYPTAAELYQRFTQLGLRDNIASFESTELAQRRYEQLQSLLYGTETWTTTQEELSRGKPLTSRSKLSDSSPWI